MPDMEHKRPTNALHDSLMSLRPQLAAVAQAQYDAWDASDPEYGDEEVGFGGICQLVADAMADVIRENIPGAETEEAGQDGDDHAWLLVYDSNGEEVYEVDIPPGVYETGGGYSWQKLPDVTITADDVYVGLAAVKVSDLAGEFGKTASPDFGYSNFNDRDEDLAEVKWETNTGNGSLTVVALKDGIDIGYVHCERIIRDTFRWSKSKGEDYAVGGARILDPSWIGTGLGQMMYDRIIKAAKAMGVEYLWSDGALSKDAEKAWSRLSNRYPVKRVRGRFRLDLSTAKTASPDFGYSDFNDRDKDLADVNVYDLLEEFGKQASTKVSISEVAHQFREEQEQEEEWEENKECFKDQCSTLSNLLAKRLRSLGFIANPYHGLFRDKEGIKHNHWWVMVGDQIVDVTADQFYPGEEDEYRTVITRIGDPRYSVKNKTASPDFGYSQYNNREKALKSITIESYGPLNSFDVYAFNKKHNQVGVIRCNLFDPENPDAIEDAWDYSIDQGDGTYDPKDVKKGQRDFSIYEAAIDAEWKGTGLGQMMYDQVVREAKARGGSRLWSDENMSSEGQSAWGRLAKRYKVQRDGNLNRNYIDLKSLKKTAMPDFGYSKFNDRDAELSRLVFDVHEGEDAFILSAYTGKNRGFQYDKHPSKPSLYQVGFIEVNQRMDDDHHWMVTLVEIGAEWKGTGLGQTLYDKAIEEITRRGGTRLYSDEYLSTDARKAWTRLSQRYNVVTEEHLGGHEDEERYPTYYIDLNGTAKKASPDFGYTQFNDRDKDISKLKWREVRAENSFSIYATYEEENRAGEIRAVRFDPDATLDDGTEGIDFSVWTCQIAKEWRGTGLGQILYEKAMQVAKAMGASRLWSDASRTFDANKAWEKLSKRYKVRKDRDRDRFWVSLDGVSKTAGLKEWFGNSKVVDDAGNPRVVYHGSMTRWLTSFDLGKETTATPGVKRGAIWFTSSYNNAEFYADGVENPPAMDDITIDGEDGEFYGFIISDDEEGDILFSVGPYATEEEVEEAAADEIARYEAQREEEKRYVISCYLKIENPLYVDVIPRDNEFAAAKAGGHDGIIAKDVVDGAFLSDIYAVFDPKQVKEISAKEFNPGDHRIRASKVASSFFPSYEDFMAENESEVLRLGDNLDFFSSSLSQDVEGWEDLSDEEQYEEIKKYAWAYFEDRYYQLVHHYETMNFPADIYRNVSLRHGIEHLYTENIGESWSWDERSAVEFHPGTKINFILHARVPENSVDWKDTFLLNLDTALGDAENEMRIKFDAPLELIEYRPKKSKEWIPMRKMVTASVVDLTSLLTQFREKFKGDPSIFNEGGCDAFVFALHDYLESKGVTSTPSCISRITYDDDGEEIDHNNFSHMVLETQGTEWDFNGPKASIRWEMGWFDEYEQSTFFETEPATREEMAKIRSDKGDPPMNEGLYKKCLTLLNQIGKAKGPKKITASSSLPMTPGDHEVRYGDARMSYKVIPDIEQVQLYSLRVAQTKRHKGAARAAMEAFTSAVDAIGYSIWLCASSLDKKTNTQGLVNFYSTFGFAPTGEKVNALGDPVMLRPAKIAKSANAVQDSQCLQEMFSRAGDSDEFLGWLEDLIDDSNEFESTLNDPALLLSYFEDWLRDEHSISIDEHGIIEFWKLTPEVRDIIGDLAVAVYHHTSSAILPKIKKEGLRSDVKRINPHSNSGAGVYVTTEFSGPVVRGYHYHAVQKHKRDGHAVTLKIRTYIADLEPDPDDEDISSGEFQYVLPYVSPEDIMWDDIEKTGSTKTARPTDQKIELLKKQMKLTDEQVEQVIATDPSPNQTDFITWIAKNLPKGNIRLPEDSEKIKGQLTAFMKAKRSPGFTGNKDINGYTPQTLFELVGSDDANLPVSNKEKDRQTVAKGSTIVLKEDNILVYKVTESDALAILSSGTNWCTAHENTAKSYLQQGPSYVIFEDGSAYGQLHPASDQYMDRSDVSFHDIIAPISRDVGITNEYELGGMILDHTAQTVASKLAETEPDVARWYKKNNMSADDARVHLQKGAIGTARSVQLAILDKKPLPKDIEDRLPASGEVNIDLLMKYGMTFHKGSPWKPLEEEMLVQPYPGPEYITYARKFMSGNWPDGEARILAEALKDDTHRAEQWNKMALEWTKSIKKGRWEELEAKIKGSQGGGSKSHINQTDESAQMAMKYCSKAIEARWPGHDDGVEDAMVRWGRMNDLDEYATKYVREPWPKYKEHLTDILQNTAPGVFYEYAVNYAEHCSKQREPEFEKVFLIPRYSSIITADYAKNVIKDRWPEYEEILARRTTQAIKDREYFSESKALVAYMKALKVHPEVVDDAILGVVNERLNTSRKDVQVWLIDFLDSLEFLWEYCKAAKEAGAPWPEGEKTATEKRPDIEELLLQGKVSRFSIGTYVQLLINGGNSWPEGEKILVEEAGRDYTTRQYFGELAESLKERDKAKTSATRLTPPAVVYHGTTHSFDEFLFKDDGPLGVHFGTLNQARFVAKNGNMSDDGNNLRIIAARITLTNPIELHDTGFYDAEVMIDFSPILQQAVADGKLPDKRTATVAQVKAHLQSLGHDGVVYKNTTAEGRGRSWIVFEPTQIEILSPDYDPSIRKNASAIPTYAEWVKHFGSLKGVKDTFDLENDESVIQAHFNKWHQFFSQMGSEITIYREIALEEIEDLRLDNVGRYWSWREDTAKAWDASNDYSLRYLLQAKTIVSGVDWFQTIGRNMSDNSHEREVTMLEGSPITLVAYKEADAANSHPWIPFKKKRAIASVCLPTPKIADHKDRQHIVYQASLAGSGVSGGSSGFWFDTDAEKAKQNFMATPEEGEPKVAQYKVSLLKPYVTASYPKAMPRRTEMLEKLKAAGYDGVIFKAAGKVVAFDEGNVKLVP